VAQVRLAMDPVPLPHPLADNVLAAWAFFLVLTWVHVWANIRALRCLVLSSLNQPRLRLLLQYYMAQVGEPGGWARFVGQIGGPDGCTEPVLL
jgi:hypothetical protein